MKKLISIILVVIFCLSLVGCGENSVNTSDTPESKEPLTTVNIAEVASTGAIPEFSVGLGNIMGDVRAEYLGDSSLVFYEKNGLYVITCQNNTYFMKKDNFAVIGLMTENVAFGIKKTETSQRIKEYLGEPAKVFTPDGTIDVYGNQEGTKTAYSYTYGDFTVTFYFLSDTLHSTILYKTDSLTEYKGA